MAREQDQGGGSGEAEGQLSGGKTGSRGSADRSRDDQPRPGGKELRSSVQKAVPDPEQLPGASDDNPLSQRVRDAAMGRKPGGGGSRLRGSDDVER